MSTSSAIGTFAALEIGDGGCIEYGSRSESWLLQDLATCVAVGVLYGARAVPGVDVGLGRINTSHFLSPRSPVSLTASLRSRLRISKSMF